MRKLIAAATAALTLTVGVVLVAPNAVMATSSMDNLIVASTANDAGGEILLTRDTSVCPVGAFSALSTDAHGRVIHEGCWSFVGKRVAIEWDKTGSLIIAEANRFTIEGRHVNSVNR